MMKKATGALIIIMLFATMVAAVEERFDIDIGGSPFLGPKDAPITMIEFIDFQ